MIGPVLHLVPDPIDQHYDVLQRLLRPGGQLGPPLLLALLEFLPLSPGRPQPALHCGLPTDPGTVSTCHCSGGGHTGRQNRGTHRALLVEFLVEPRLDPGVPLLLVHRLLLVLMELFLVRLRLPILLVLQAGRQLLLDDNRQRRQWRAAAVVATVSGGGRWRAVAGASPRPPCARAPPPPSGTPWYPTWSPSVPQLICSCASSAAAAASAPGRPGSPASPCRRRAWPSCAAHCCAPRCCAPRSCSPAHARSAAAGEAARCASGRAPAVGAHGGAGVSCCCWKSRAPGISRTNVDIFERRE